MTSSERFSVALIGFSAFERSTFAAFFRLAARRKPAYVVEYTAEAADLLIVDGEQPPSDDLGLDPERCILVGDGPLARKSPWRTNRPINMMVLTRLLDSCSARLAGACPRVQSLVPLATPTAADPRPVPAIARPATQTVTPLRPPPIQQPKRSEPRPDHILVVDDSDIALRFMSGCLERFGFLVQLARSGEEALSRLEQTPFELVFMDVNMPGLDGYKTCKAIKRRPYGAGQRPPTVVMLTSRGDKADRLRGIMAGCDDYLTKPLRQDDLLKIVGDRIVSDVREADTMRMTY